MKVRTIKDHANDFGVRDGLPYEKSGSSHLIYEIDDEVQAQALIDAGVVEKADGNGQNRGAAGTGAGAKRAS